MDFLNSLKIPISLEPSTSYKEIYPEHVFDYDFKGINCATEDYGLGSTSEIAFTFETDVVLKVGMSVLVNTFQVPGGSNAGEEPFVFYIIDVVKKKTLQNRYLITCSDIWNEIYSMDSLIEKSDLTNLPANYTLYQLALFACHTSTIITPPGVQDVLVNKDYIVNENWWYQGITYRQLWQWCCQLLGINDASTLKLYSMGAYSGIFAPTEPTENNCLYFSSNNVKSVDLAGYNTPVIDKIWFGNESTDVGFSLGSGNQILMIPSNPLINPEDSSFLNPIFNKVNALQSYSPMKLELFHTYEEADLGPWGRTYILNNQRFTSRDIENENIYVLYNNIWNIPKTPLYIAGGVSRAYTPLLSPVYDTCGFLGHTDTTSSGTRKYVNYGERAYPNTHSRSASRNNLLKNFSMEEAGIDVYYVDDLEQYPDSKPYYITTANNIKKFVSAAEPGSMLSICIREEVYEEGRLVDIRTKSAWASDEIEPNLSNGKECQFLILEIKDDGFTARRGGDDSTIVQYTWTEFEDLFPPYLHNPFYDGTEETFYTLGCYVEFLLFPKASFEADSKSSSGGGSVTFLNDTDLYISPYNFANYNNKQNNLYVTVPAGTTLDKDNPTTGWIDWSVYSDWYFDNHSAYKELTGWHNVKYEDKILYFYDGREWISSYYSDGEDIPATYDTTESIPLPEYTPAINEFSLPQLAWNLAIGTYEEQATWMCYTDDDGTSYYCPIFNWEVNPRSVVLEGTGNGDRRAENSYLSYDLKTAGKYESINSAITNAESDVSGVTTAISALNVRVGNVEASVNNKVDIIDYNGNTIIDKINAVSTTSTISASRVDLSDYAQSSNLAAVATSGDYDDLLNKPTIPTVPTDISAFTNDSGYLVATDLSSTGTVTVDASRITGLINPITDTDTYETQVADTYEYSGVSFQVPTGKVFYVEITGAITDTAEPTGIAVSSSDSTLTVIKQAEGTAPVSMTLVGNPSSDTTYYVWIKSNLPGEVGISYVGWYM